jgi:hypothetical protein
VPASIPRTETDLRTRQSSGELATLREELVRANAEVARLVALAAEIPDLVELGARLKALQRERGVLEAR